MNIKNCPFCGNEAKIKEGHEHTFIGGYTISLLLECSCCSAGMSSCFGNSMGKEITKESAINKLVSDWNKRNDKDELIECLKDLLAWANISNTSSSFYLREKCEAAIRSQGG